MYNSATVTICGNLGSDIEIKTAKNGQEYGILNVAVNRIVNDKSNQSKVKTSWFPVFIWNQKILKKSANFLMRGQTILITGELEVFERPAPEESKITINVTKDSNISVLAKLQDLIASKAGKNLEACVSDIEADTMQITN